ncbi:hypothetical protein, partial [Bradyrhizobium sp. MOS001]|uniref:hypothetical protein n=1 Tax=Bradyrhizobium sp. MOS001 TaxID=2133948 RepID=UPI001961A15E
LSGTKSPLACITLIARDAQNHSVHWWETAASLHRHPQGFIGIHKYFAAEPSPDRDTNVNTTTTWH